MMTSEKIELKNQKDQVFYTAEYEAENEWIYSNWFGYLDVEEVKAGANAGLALLIQAHTSKFLNDNRQLEGSWDDANEWIAQDWMPRALQAGLKKFAHVVSPDIYAALSAEEMESNVLDFEMKIFEDFEAAKVWLSS